MAYFHRLIFTFIVLLSCWFPTSSYASFAATSSGAWGSSSGLICSSATDIAAAPCLVAASDSTTTSNLKNCYVGTITSATQHSVLCTRIDVNALRGATAWYVTKNVCPSNSTLSGSTCTCNASYTEGGGFCTSQTDIIVNALNFVGAILVGTGPVSLTACYQGIIVTGTGGAATPTGSHNEVIGPFTSDGTPCTPTADSTVSISDCPANSVRGTVMGVSVCSPTSDTNTVAAGPTQAASSPSGAASAPTLGGGAPAGAVGSTTGTTCIGEKCTTTTKFTNSAGATIGTTTKDQPKISFCSENPSASICAKSSISVGSCGTPPACSGDAIQCAVAAQTFKTACALAPSPGQETAAYDAAKGLTGNQITNLPGNNTLNISSSSFDQSEFLGAAVGAQDVTVTVAHKLITLPLSQVNIWLARLGSLLQAVTFLVCLKIVTREA